MRAHPVVPLAALGALMAAVPVLAHHSFSAVYDSARPITLRGTVRKLEFTNPHIWVHLDVADDTRAVPWACEGGSPNRMTRRGWTSTSLRPGDQIVLEGLRARDGSASCQLRTVTFADGRRVAVRTDVRAVRAGRRRRNR
jgi:hypothetical protein